MGHELNEAQETHIADLTESKVLPAVLREDRTPGYGDHMQRSTIKHLQKTPGFGPQIAPPSGILGRPEKVTAGRCAPVICPATSVCCRDAHAVQGPETLRVLADETGNTLKVRPGKPEKKR
eukprot:47354-Pelagomonas_calceolata.AAC.1